MIRHTAVLLALVGCADPPPPAAAPPAPEDPTAWLVRASLDLRGIRPSPAELEAASADPEAGVDAWLEDPRFELRVRDLFARVYRTRVDTFGSGFYDGGSFSRAFVDAVGDEPLVVIGRVAAEDRPYTDIVTSDTTFANIALAREFPVDRPSGAPDWQEVEYTDGRPMSGVLSTNGLWWRYTSTAQNYNRGRANALSRILLCDDFAARPVAFSRTGVEDEGGDRTRTDPACLSCHAGLDPLASFLFGFRSDDYFLTPDYSLANERDWLGATGVAPGFFGRPGDDLRDLGIAIASDPRFLDCAVEQVWTGLYNVESVDPAVLDRHRAAFLQDGARLKGLFRSIVLDPEYRTAPPRLLPIESIASAVEDLTGFRWTDDEEDMLANDIDGLRTLGGGMDGRTVTRPATAPSATTVLVTQRLAELAGPYAVAHDADRPEEERLLAGIDFGETVDADRPELEATIDGLVRRALGRAPVDDEVADLLETWEAAASLTSPADAWAAVLVVLIRDPEFVLY